MSKNERKVTSFANRPAEVEGYDAWGEWGALCAAYIACQFPGVIMSHEHGLDCDESECEDWEDEPRCADSSGEHDWSSHERGGCDENPGVWSLGGTTMVFEAQCQLCGLVRREKHFGSQRNPDECDVRTFFHDDDWGDEVAS
jgi:hypothetical protein